MIRSILARGVRKLLEAVEPHLARPRVIYDRGGTSPYLSRYYLFGGPRDALGDAFDGRGNPKPSAVWRDLPVNLYLHKFHKGDDDRSPHNHPWQWALSLVLAGGYMEERVVERFHDEPPRLASRLVSPLSFNVLRGDDFHRVDLIEKDCWSLFLVGPRATSWAFMDRGTGKTIPWRKFLGAEA